MKKITLLFALLITSIGFSQTYDLLESFNGTGYEGAFGGTSAAYDADPTNASIQVVKITSTNGSGEVWQGINVILTNSYKLTSATQLTMQLDVYSTSAITIAPKAQGGVSGAPESVSSVDHSGGGWETLTFTFDKSLDGKVPANGDYNDFALHINWDTGANNFGAPDGRIFYIKNLKGLAVVTASDPVPSAAAAVPTTADANAYSIYNDTNNYTTSFNVQYGFGTSSAVDLDPSAAVNNALKMNLEADGFGQGEGGPDDISSYDFVNFNYWFSNSKGTAGFVFIMIDNDGAVQEFKYQVGISTAASDSADIVENAWTQVSIPMSHFTDLGFDSTKLFQWKVDKYNQSGDNGGFLYLDNIVLTKNVPLSIENNELLGFSMYPNPTNNVLNISAKGAIQNAEIFNVLGKRVKSFNVNDTKETLDVSDLASGIYLVKYAVDGSTGTAKFIKQ
ncbi:T9SS type A sorting domain-containing protein [Polaribacter porphyrae]|uniref:Secretion system C-terminal sorting domain-containing protein n=1 Tax=Polaribacter porphyrae TaxID=1137780 RepID=A0A2S7WN06_9FLAO|nr:T9SS type A sorting domain-containing protein [Polaribacter porphyrae]PQJ78702.1 hypothetical protein BTO18_05660 [Polaribacter porphyrae]